MLGDLDLNKAPCAVLLIRFSTLVLGQTKRPCQAAKHANTDKSSVLLVLANRNQEDFTDLRTMGQGFKAAGARVIMFDTDRARFICLDHIHMTEPYHRLMAKLRRYEVRLRSILFS
jgi:hypothetical protein